MSNVLDLLAGSLLFVFFGFGLLGCLALGGALGRALRGPAAAGDALTFVWYFTLGWHRNIPSVLVKKAVQRSQRSRPSPNIASPARGDPYASGLCNIANWRRCLARNRQFLCQ